MTISTALTADAKAKGTVQDSTAAVLAAATATPRSIRARLTLNLEDIAAIGQANFESALRQNAGAALSDALDDQTINGDNSAPNINGLINQLTDPSNPTALILFDTFLKSFSDQIDGLWAARIKDVMIVANVDAYRLASQTFRGTAANGGPALTFSDYAQMATGGFSTNKRHAGDGRDGRARDRLSARAARDSVPRVCRPGAAWPLTTSIRTRPAAQRHFTLNVLVGSQVLVVQPDAYGLVE